MEAGVRTIRQSARRRSARRGLAAGRFRVEVGRIELHIEEHIVAFLLQELDEAANGLAGLHEVGGGVAGDPDVAHKLPTLSLV